MTYRGLSRQNPLWVLSSFLKFRAHLNVHTELWDRGQLTTPPCRSYTPQDLQNQEL